MRISDWSSDVCSSDLVVAAIEVHERIARAFLHDVARPNEALFIIQSGRGFGLFEIDRKSVVSGKSVSVRVDLGGRRIIKKNRLHSNKKYKQTYNSLKLCSK